MITRKIKWVLATSLILNIFLLSCIVSGTYHLFWSNAAPLANKPVQNALRFAADGLSLERQQAFQKLLRETRREAKPFIKAAQVARTDVRALLAAPEFDRGAISIALAHAREADIALRLRIEASLINFAESLSPEEREKFAEGLARQGPLRQMPPPKKP